MDPLSWPAAIGALGAAGYGAAVGAWARGWLATARHRRYADERARPLPGFGWVPVVAALGAAALALRLAPAGVGPAGAYAALAPLYVVLAAVDLDVHRLPDVLTLPAYPLVAAALGVAAGSSGGSGAARALAGGIGTGLAFGLLHLASGRRLGLGDVKLAGPLGALLAWFSWDRLLAGVYVMFLLGGAAALWLLIRRRGGPQSRIAFGPAMIGGAALVVLGGGPLPS